MSDQLDCFKAYDIRGRLPDQLNEDIARRIGRAYAEWLQPRTVVVGYDIRLSSNRLCEALTAGLIETGVDVVNIGQCGTEEIYFATSHLQVDGGIVVTASHNPKNFNGMKLVRANSIPISGDTGLNEIKQLAERNEFKPVPRRGSVSFVDTRLAYVEHLLGYIDRYAIKPLSVVCNAGNGGAGVVIDLLEAHLPIEFIKLHHNADGNFPNGVPNPLLIENRQVTSAAVVSKGADFGIAWDGDFDRCFFFDETGRFIEGYYIVGLLAASFLKKYPGASIVHDPRLTWNTIDIARAGGGKAIQCKTGHAFMKECMRREDAVYGGEMSAHHYFRDFYYCDSGMIPWLLVAELVSVQGKPLSTLVNECMRAYPASGEINRTIKDPAALLTAIERHYMDAASSIDHTDGLSMSFADWRFNVRMSNTEPVVRLNVESRGDEVLMQAKTQEILDMMK